MKTKFNGQLKGDVAKEKWFSELRKSEKIALPKIGATSEVKLPMSKLDGAFLSCLDGGGSLSIDNKKVSKIKVYTGELALPKKFELTFVMARNSDASTRLKASIVTKK